MQCTLIQVEEQLARAEAALDEVKAEAQYALARAQAEAEARAEADHKTQQAVEQQLQEARQQVWCGCDDIAFIAWVRCWLCIAN